MKRTLFPACLLLGALGCGDGSSSWVVLDFGPLWQQARQSVDQIDVRVYADNDALLMQQILTNMQATVELELLAGPRRRFEVEASKNTTEPPWTPSYWGERRVDLEPGETVVPIVVPVFPAGALQGTVVVTDNTALPADLAVRASAVNPRPDSDATRERDLPLTSGAFAATLIDGEYSLRVSFTTPEATTYRGSTRATVVREQIVDAGVMQVAR